MPIQNDCDGTLLNISTMCYLQKKLRNANEIVWMKIIPVTMYFLIRGEIGTFLKVEPVPIVQS